MLTSLLSQQVTARHDSRTLEIYKVLSYPASHWSFPRVFQDGYEEMTGFQRGVLSEAARQLSGSTAPDSSPRVLTSGPLHSCPSSQSSWKGVPKSSQEKTPWNMSVYRALSASKNLLPTFSSGTFQTPLGRKRQGHSRQLLACLSTLQIGNGRGTPRPCAGQELFPTRRTWQ